MKTLYGSRAVCIKFKHVAERAKAIYAFTNYADAGIACDITCSTAIL
jgi:hypothetical protein